MHAAAAAEHNYVAARGLAGVSVWFTFGHAVPGECYYYRECGEINYKQD